MRDNKIKIAHVVEGFVGGLATYMCGVLPGLVKNGFDVSLICSIGRACPDTQSKLKKLSLAGVKIYLIPMHRNINPIKDFYSFIIILYLMIKNRFDIVHTHCSKAGAIGRVGAFFAGVDVRIHSSHCLAFLRCGNFITKKFFYYIEKTLAPITTKYVAVSIAEIDIAVEMGIYPSQKCVLINNGVACPANLNVDANRRNQIKTQLGIPENAFVITTACRLVNYKGLFIFIKAAELVKSNCIFLVAGDGDLKYEMQQYIAQKYLNKKIRLLGHFSDMAAIYDISDITVLCSSAEAQPYFLLEAMSRKRPVIATDVMGNRELLKNGRGILIRPNSAELALQIDRIIANSDIQKTLTEKAYEYIKDNHKLDEQIAKLTENYRTLLFSMERTGQIEIFADTKYRL